MDGVWAFLELCVAPANIAYSTLVLALLGYWALVLAGMADPDAGTPDLAVDMDVNVDVDVDVGASLDVDAAPDGALSGHAASDGTLGEILLDRDTVRGVPPGGTRPRRPWWLALLLWLGIGRVPLAVFLTLWVPLMWVLSLTATDALGWRDGAAFAALALPVIVAGAVGAKGLSYPFGLLFRGLNESGEEDFDALDGLTGAVISETVDADYGQAEFPREGVPLTLNVRARGGRVYSRGTRVRVVDGPDGRNVYTVDAATPPR